MSEEQTILLVEDDRPIREFVASALEGEGYRIVEAGTAAHAAVEAGARRPDLVVLDLGLPDRDGIDFIRDYRAWSAIPILILSARAQEANKVAALDAGADDYLTKPFGVAELLARVRALLRRRQADRDAPEPVIRFGDIAVDCVRRVVERRGEPLHLTQIEYRLLLFLASNPGRVLTHRQLLLQVWGGRGVENHQYLRVYVGHLRQKIEDNPTQPRHILTEIGVGYRFQP
ncbi:MAG TPA: response regulator [Rhodocyclaceae bacterium]|nr:response regulator [Rhodocyclaceae bacterium]